MGDLEDGHIPDPEVVDDVAVEDIAGVLAAPEIYGDFLAFPDPFLGKAAPDGVGDDDIAGVVVDHRRAHDAHAVDEEPEPLPHAYLPARADAVLESGLLEFDALPQGVDAVHEENALAAPGRAPRA